MKYDPLALGFIKIDDLPEMILDMAHEEHETKTERLMSNKELWFNLTAYSEVRVLMKIRHGLPLTEIESYVQQHKRVHA